jgi:hypothetical protein
MTPPSPAFRGNKASLPTKTCEACGRPMTWRRRWARTWEEVKYCSDACRRAKGGRGGTAEPGAEPASPRPGDPSRGRGPLIKSGRPG